MKTQSAKAKGRKLQQKIVKFLLNTIPNLEPDDVKSTGMGQSGEDIQLSPYARKRIPWSIECKKRAKIAVYSYYDQAKTNAGKYEPVVFIEADRKKPLAVVDAEYLISLLGEAQK